MATPVVAARIEAIVGRLLKFRELKSEKGWPHSRQYTSKLVKAGKIPPPRKRPGGGSLNLWDEDEWDAYQGTFVSVLPPPDCLTLTESLVDALSADSVEGIVAAIKRLRAALGREGGTPSDVVVTLKEQSAAAGGRAAREAATSNTT
jgi:hypothetical protein